MCNGEIIFVCPSSTVFTSCLFYSALVTAAPQHGSPAGCISSGGSCPGVSPPQATVPQGCPSFQKHVSSPICPQESVPPHVSSGFSPHVSSYVLPYQLSLSPKRAHAQHLLCLQGKHLADRQVKYDPKSLRASADLPLSLVSFGLCPNGMKTWQKNV